MSSAQSRNILIRFSCSLNSEAKKRRPCWQRVPATCSVHGAEACEHQQSKCLSTNGQMAPLKVIDSSGLGPAWVTDSMSSAPPPSDSRNCISSPAPTPPPGKVTLLPPKMFSHLASWTLITSSPHPGEQMADCCSSQFLSDHSAEHE